jgi:hypothetical protein
MNVLRYLLKLAKEAFVFVLCGSIFLMVAFPLSLAYIDASSGKSVGNWRAQRYGSLRNRWSLRQVASRECCSSSEPLWISGPLSA